MIKEQYVYWWLFQMLVVFDKQSEEQQDECHLMDLECKFLQNNKRANSKIELYIFS